MPMLLDSRYNYYLCYCFDNTIPIFKVLSALFPTNPSAIAFAPIPLNPLLSIFIKIHCMT